MSVYETSYSPKGISPEISLKITFCWTKTVPSCRRSKVACGFLNLAELIFHYFILCIMLLVQILTRTDFIDFFLFMKRSSCGATEFLWVDSPQFFLYNNFLFIMPWTWHELSFFDAQKFCSSVGFRIKTMVSLVKWVVFSNWRMDIIKTNRSGLLGSLWKVVSESLNSRPKKLEWEWLFLNLERTFIDVILSWSRIFCFEFVDFLLSSGFA